MQKYQLSDLLDVSHIQAVANSNHIVLGLPMTVIDTADNSVLVKTGWPDVCPKCYQNNQCTQNCYVTIENCIPNDFGAADYSCFFKCKNGLWNFTVPIKIEGLQFGTLQMSQFFFEEERLERDNFIRQMKKLNFDIEDYLAAIMQLPVFTKEKIHYVILIYKAMADFIGTQADQSIKLNKYKNLLWSRKKNPQHSYIFKQ